MRDNESSIFITSVEILGNRQIFLPRMEKKFSNSMSTLTTLNTANGADTSYTVNDSCITTMAVNSTVNSTNIIICPSAFPPTATEGVIFVFFPKTSGNCNAANYKCDIWLGFNTTSAVPIINGIKHTSNSSATVNSNNFSCTSGSCRNNCTPKCSFSGVTCQPNQVGVSINIEFAAGVAAVVSKDACPCGTVVFLNLDNRLGYHAMFDSSDGDPGLDFVFPECCNGCANVVYSATAKAVIDAYRRVFKHPVSTETMTPTDRANFVLGEVAKYGAQNVARCNSSCGSCNSSCGSCGSSCGSSCEQSCESKCKSESSCESKCSRERGCGCEECRHDRERRREKKRRFKSCEKNPGCGCPSCRITL